MHSLGPPAASCQAAGHTQTAKQRKPHARGPKTGQNQCPNTGPVQAVKPTQARQGQARPGTQASVIMSTPHICTPTPTVHFCLSLNLSLRLSVCPSAYVPLKHMPANHIVRKPRKVSTVLGVQLFKPCTQIQAAGGRWEGVLLQPLSNNGLLKSEDQTVQKKNKGKPSFALANQTKGPLVENKFEP